MTSELYDFFTYLPNAALIAVVAAYYVMLYKWLRDPRIILLAELHTSLAALLTYAVVQFITSSIGWCAIAEYGGWLL